MGPTNQISSLTVKEAFRLKDTCVFLDVRKPMAVRASGQSVKGSQYRHPFDALNWKDEFAERDVVVFCVHGHEVSQSVCGFLRDEGMHVRYLEGGFEAWLKEKLPVQRVGGTGDE